MSHSWKDYEIFVTSLHAELGEASHNVKLPGKSGTQHQIDCVLEKQEGIYTYKTIVSCKHWNTKVKKEHVMTWKETVDDCKANAGAIFSLNGFQSGAIKYAKHHGLYLFHIKEVKEEDRAGCLNRVDIKMRSFRAETISVIPDIEPLLGKTNSQFEIKIDKQNAILYDSEKTVYGNYMEDINRKINLLPIEEGVQEFKMSYEVPSYILVKGDFYRLRSIDVKLRFVESPQPSIEIDYIKDYPYELIEVTEDKIYPISKNKLPSNVLEP